jgi:hypothetical protein
MAISFSCAECDHAFKVKDDLAGRKIKCPECGESNSVPAGKAKTAGAVAAAKAKAKPADTDDYEEVEERAQKKRKKRNRNKSNTGRILLAGGALLFIAALVVLVIVIVNRKPEEPKEKVRQEPQARPSPSPIDPEKKVYSAGVAGTMDRVEMRNMMQQLGIAYKNFVAEKNKGPANRDELAGYYEKHPRILEMLDKKWVTFIYGAGPREVGDSPSRLILAFQTDKDAAGIRIVLMANGVIDEMLDGEFQKTKKAR